MITDHFKKLHAEYEASDLNLEDLGDGSFSIKGVLRSLEAYKGIEEELEFSLEILVPSDYPDIAPTVKETGGRIPRTIEHHVSEKDGTLCLETRIGVAERFRKKPDLVGFVQNLVVHFLFRFVRIEKKMPDPFGEWRHGVDGLIDDYAKRLDLSDISIAYNFLFHLASRASLRNGRCLCGSGKLLRRCHKELLQKIANTVNNRTIFEDDFIDATNSLIKQKIPLSNQVIYLFKQLSARRA